MEVGAAHRHVRVVRELGRRVAAVKLMAVDDGIHVDFRQLGRLIAAANRIVTPFLVREVRAAADRYPLLAQGIGELVDERRAGVRLEFIVAVALHLADKDALTC
jgi:hypothetical protein